MPFYVIDSIFTQPFDTFGDTVAAHRAYLQQGYDSGLLLCSGPKADRQGGIVIANASDPDEITRFLACEPYQQQGLAHYLQSIQKYVVCPHSDCSHFSQLLICVQCGQVQEVAMPAALLTALQQQAEELDFQLAPQFLELKGVCGRCRGSAIDRE